MRRRHDVVISGCERCRALDDELSTLTFIIVGLVVIDFVGAFALLGWLLAR